MLWLDFQMLIPTSPYTSVSRRERWCTRRGTPDAHHSSCRHHLEHCRHSSDKWTGIAGSSVAGDKCDFSYHQRCHILIMVLEKDSSNKAKWPRIFHILEEGDERKCPPLLGIWQFRSSLDWPSLEWCLSSSHDTESRWLYSPTWTAQFFLKRRKVPIFYVSWPFTLTDLQSVNLI